MLGLAVLVLALTGSRSAIVHEPLPADDPKLRRPDITVARDVLRWEPSVSLTDGLSRTIAWFRDHRDWVRSVHERAGACGSYSPPLNGSRPTTRW